MMGSWWLNLDKTPLLVVVLSVLIIEAKDYSIHQKISEDTDLSQFYTLLENNPVANITLMHRQITIFAPINMAFKKEVKDKNSLGLYHMTNLAQSLDQLGTSVNSQLDGNPPLWITRRKILGTNREDIFINNAKILQERSNYQQMFNNKRQVLHIIDSVLEPIANSQIYNPDAFQLLNQSENLDLNNHRVRSFRQRVNLMNKGDIFKSEGRNTFFIPVDEGFKPPPRPEMIDHKVIDGHVIPNHVLFTNAVDMDKDMETLAFGDNIRVSISFTQQAGKVYVKSNTVVGDMNHPKGVVLAEIVKANIPVKNGVVHLIQRPLMVVDNTVQQFLQSFKENVDGPLNKFYTAIANVDEFMKKMSDMKNMTLFAPSNEAMAQTSALLNLKGDRKKMLEILNLHLVPRPITLENIVERNSMKDRGEPTAANQKFLYFNVVSGKYNNHTVTVEGGGVNATIIQPNIAATNGIVHIIDRILGVPFTTVAEKLASDPMLNKTYYLGQHQGFNNELKSMKKKFTYFVPRDYAWDQALITSPSAHKKVFMSDFKYHVRQILERHLVISDRVYTMADLKVMASDTITLPTQRDHLKIKVEYKNNKYYIKWQGEEVEVFRPDVECTNGIIHVINQVLMKESDIRVNGGISPFLAPHLAMIITAKWLLL